jgi:hypothetical protein
VSSSSVVVSNGIVSDSGTSAALTGEREIILNTITKVSSKQKMRDSFFIGFVLSKKLPHLITRWGNNSLGYP